MGFDIFLSTPAAHLHRCSLGSSLNPYNNSLTRFLLPNLNVLQSIQYPEHLIDDLYLITLRLCSIPSMVSICHSIKALTQKPCRDGSSVLQVSLTFPHSSSFTMTSVPATANSHVFFPVSVPLLMLFSPLGIIHIPHPDAHADDSKPPTYAPSSCELSKCERAFPCPVT